jgi:hypothetical protein
MRLGVGLRFRVHGKMHALGFANANRLFALPVEAKLAPLADISAERAASAARTLGFERSTGDWRQLVSDDSVDIVDITTPNTLHKEMALAAIAAGKHVYCEKPLAATVDDALEMTLAAEKSGIATAVGLNYLKNPLSSLPATSSPPERSVTSGPSTGSMPRTTGRTPIAPGAGGSIRRGAEAHWRISAAISSPRRAIWSARSRRFSATSPR